MMPTPSNASRGRIVNVPGGSILAEFGGVQDAGACGVEVRVTGES